MSNIIITLIAAAAENNVIGKDNKLIWHLPNDLKFFKKNTLDHSVVMGRKTFDSMGKALPNRRNIVITRDQNWMAPDVDVANSANEVLTYCRDEREIFIIGGAEIYNLFLPIANKIILTRVHTHIDGHAYFPAFDQSVWRKVSEERHEKDEKHAYAYTFEVYEKS